MKIVSANLAQRLGNPAARERFLQWLRNHSPDFLLAQEPFKPSQTARPEIPGYRLVSTSAQISVWVKEPGASPEVTEHSDRWHEISFCGWAIHNVYLSPYSARERCELLIDLTEALRNRKDENVLILGDFNLAPQPEDGLFGDLLSKFTKAPERKALMKLLAVGGLADATAPGDGAPREFTFERLQRGQSIRFRCDLCLVPTALAGQSEISYDHSVRAATSGFTDHSAIVARLPGHEVAAHTPNRGQPEQAQDGPRTGLASSYVASAYKTAIRRTGASQIAKCLWDQGVLKELSIRSIMDFGACQQQ